MRLFEPCYRRTPRDKEGWQTYTWHVAGACFAKAWGYDVNFGLEKSAPFVIGKVEVSTEAFAE